MKRIFLVLLAGVGLVAVLLARGCGPSPTSEPREPTGDSIAPPSPPTVTNLGTVAPAEPAGAAAGVAGLSTHRLRYAAQPGCRVTIDGTSTIHDWTVKGAIIGGSFEIEPAFQTDLTLKSVPSLAGSAPPPTADLFIPIGSLKSQVTVGSDVMDRVMQEAMRAKDHPRITFRLVRMTLASEVPPTGSPVRFNVQGDLQVSGVTNRIDLDVTLERLDANRFKFSGRRALKMTDFGIKPPSPKFVGPVIKTGDAVTVAFEWVLAAKREPAL